MLKDQTVAGLGDFVLVAVEGQCVLSSDRQTLWIYRRIRWSGCGVLEVGFAEASEFPCAVFICMES